MQLAKAVSIPGRVLLARAHRSDLSCLNWIERRGTEAGMEKGQPTRNY
jgi:hypothetical protein